MPVVTQEIAIEISPQTIDQHAHALAVHSRNEVMKLTDLATPAIGHSNNLPMLQIGDEEHLPHEQLCPSLAVTGLCCATKTSTRKFRHCHRQVRKQLAVHPSLDVEPSRQPSRQIRSGDVEGGKRTIRPGFLQTETLLSLLELSDRKRNRFAVAQLDHHRCQVLIPNAFADIVERRSRQRLVIRHEDNGWHAFHHEDRLSPNGPVRLEQRLDLQRIRVRFGDRRTADVKRRRLGGIAEPVQPLLQHCIRHATPLSLCASNRADHALRRSKLGGSC